MTRLLTLAEHSRRLGRGLDHRGEKLRRMLLAAERACHRRIGIRISGAHRTTWKVTEVALRQHLPALFEREEEQEDFRKLVREHLRDVERTASEVAREAAHEEVMGVRQELGEAVVEVATGVEKLERRVYALERKDAKHPTFTEQNGRNGVPGSVP